MRGSAPITSAVVAALIGAASDVSGMEFIVVENGDRARWIAAEGEISAETPDDFIRFMDGAGADALTGALVHLDSKGGDLAAAMRLGDLFRAYGLGTTVSASPGSEQPDGARRVDAASSGEAGRCASACLLAFVGGEPRFASRDSDPRWISGRSVGALEVHPFSFEAGLGSAAGAAGRVEGESAAADTAKADPISEREVFDYLNRHGVSAEVLQIGMLVPPGASLPLTEVQIRRLALDSGQPRSIEMRGYENGVGIIEVALTRPSGTYLLELYCRGGKMEILASVDWAIGMAAEEFDGLGIFAGTELEGHGRAQLAKVEHREEGERLSSKATLVLEAPLAELTRERVFRFEDETGPEASRVARDLSFAFPEGTTMPRLLPGACL